MLAKEHFGCYNENSQGRQRQTQRDPLTFIQMGISVAEGGGGGGGGEMWFESRSNLKVRQTEFTNGYDLGCMRMGP